MAQYLPSLMHLFGGVTPLNVREFEIRDYLSLTRAVDAHRSEVSKANG